MSDAFFLPVGRNIEVSTIKGEKLCGELKGLINFGGIPAVWITNEQPRDNTDISVMDTEEHICLIQNVVSIRVIKKGSETIIFNGGL